MKQSDVNGAGGHQTKETKIFKKAGKITPWDDDKMPYKDTKSFIVLLSLCLGSP